MIFFFCFVTPFFSTNISMYKQGSNFENSRFFEWDFGDYRITKGKLNLKIFWAVKEEFPVEVGKYKFSSTFILLKSLLSVPNSRDDFKLE